MPILSYLRSFLLVAPGTVPVIYFRSIILHVILKKKPCYLIFYSEE